jgi:hypothetical protein
MWKWHFNNTSPEADKKVPLFKLDSLWKASSPPQASGTSSGSKSRAILQNVRDFNDEPKSIVMQDAQQPDAFVVNKRLTSTYELKNTDGSVRKSFRYRESYWRRIGAI